MSVHYTNRALKDLEALPQEGRRRIVSALDRFAETGEGDVRALTGQWKGRFRLRVGSWRAVFKVENDVVVIRVLHRREAYR